MHVQTTVHEYLGVGRAEVKGSMPASDAARVCVEINENTGASGKKSPRQNGRDCSRCGVDWSSDVFNCV